MKNDIHPKYGKSTIKCGCGAVHEIGGTVPEVTVEICASCHPFYTGQQKFVDTMGRVERFQKKFGGEYFKKAEKKKTLKRSSLQQ